MKDKPRILVVGGGSIGQRHIKNLLSLGASVTVQEPDPGRLSAFVDMGVPVISKDACDSLMGHFHGAIVAVPPHLHASCALPLLQAGLRVLIEKPLAHTVASALTLSLFHSQIRVGYSMRFHPAIVAIKQNLSIIGRPIHAHAEVGQYLPQWHPNEDYRSWYMSKIEQGGGALLDLSHELDYLQWLISPVSAADAFVGQPDPSLLISSDSLADIRGWLGNRTRFTCHMDLIDRSYNRRVRILGEEGTIEWNYQEGMVKVWREEKLIKAIPVSGDRNTQFVNEAKAFLRFCKGEEPMNPATYQESLHIVEMAEDLLVTGHYKHQHNREGAVS